MAWVRCCGGGKPKRFWFVEEGIAKVTYTGGATQGANFVSIWVSGGTHGDFIANADFTGYNTLYINYDSGYGNVTNILINNVTVQTISNATGSGTVAIDVSQLNGILPIKITTTGGGINLKNVYMVP